MTAALIAATTDAHTHLCKSVYHYSTDSRDCRSTENYRECLYRCVHKEMKGTHQYLWKNHAQLTLEWTIFQGQVKSCVTCYYHKETQDIILITYHCKFFYHCSVSIHYYKSTQNYQQYQCRHVHMEMMYTHLLQQL